MGSGAACPRTPDTWESRRQGRGKLIRMVDVNEIADWMASEVEVEGFLYQDMAVAHIAEQFGDAFIYTNENGTRAISEAVLSAFRNLTEGTVIWDQWDKCWRQRQPDDPAAT
jgi:hypothetical protein